MIGANAYKNHVFICWECQFDIWASFLQRVFAALFVLAFHFLDALQNPHNLCSKKGKHSLCTTHTRAHSKKKDINLNKWRWRIKWKMSRVTKQTRKEKKINQQMNWISRWCVIRLQKSWVLKISCRSKRNRDRSANQMYMKSSMNRAGRILKCNALT